MQIAAMEVWKSRAAADLVSMLPLELTLIERNSFAKNWCFRILGCRA